eukprot:CAMPEP_0172697920 /NCGR_PEP_ID=MMETSP1074-20121228/29087_1 /TAXON_ID=2916 /ORGANISM="Ceratium fusus, Strain PA161109" /LENGTH=58 /DNA_ID=CAMNT_0013518877 /DNA_START=88 /DNA_END=261 /DNA_ORIENTATION=-
MHRGQSLSTERMRNRTGGLHVCTAQLSKSESSRKTSTFASSAPVTAAGMSFANNGVSG